MERSGPEKSDQTESAVPAHGRGADIRFDDFTAFVHPAGEGGYWAEVPALPGCITEGDTLDEVFQNLNEAIQGWIGAQTPESLAALGVRFSRVTDAEHGPAPRSPRVRSLEFAA